MPEQIIDLLINYGAHPEQATGRQWEIGPGENDRPLNLEEWELNTLFTRDRAQILGAVGMDTLIAQATLVLEEDEEEEEEEDEDEGKGKGAT